MTDSRRLTRRDGMCRERMWIENVLDRAKSPFSLASPKKYLSRRKERGGVLIGWAPQGAHRAHLPRTTLEDLAGCNGTDVVLSAQEENVAGRKCGYPGGLHGLDQ